MGEKVRIYFTFHYVSINTFTVSPFDSFASVFTFHYVSINTVSDENNTYNQTTLHSTMFLLIPASPDESCPEKLSLHSTMFLLIHKRYAGGKPGDQNFTFHYVSINTLAVTSKVADQIFFTFHYVSINTQHHF